MEEQQGGTSMNNEIIRAFAKAGVKYRLHVREDIEFLDDASEAVGNSILWSRDHPKKDETEFEKAAKPLMDYLKKRGLQMRYFGEFATAIVSAEQAKLYVTREDIRGNLNYLTEAGDEGPTSGDEAE